MMRMNTFWIVVLALGFLSGCAQMSPLARNYSNEIRNVELLNGTVTGTSFGSFADFKISWDDGSIGSYLGMLDHDIRLVGITFSVDDPVTQATWVSS